MKAQPSILIVGGNGFVGSTIARDLANDYKVFASFNKKFVPIAGVTHLPVNMNDKDAPKRPAIMAHPNVVIFCGGAHDWVEAEKDQKLTQVVHSGAPGNILTASEVFKPKFIYVSCDLVFSGKTGNFHEEDPTLPFMALGKAKVGAENFIRGKSLNHVIIRCAPLLGRGPVDHPSAWDRLRMSIAKGEVTQFSSRMSHNPVHISALIHAIRRVIQGDIRNKTFHIAGRHRVSEYELAVLLGESVGANTAMIQESDSTNATYDFSLNVTETMNTLKTEPIPIEKSIELLLQHN